MRADVFIQGVQRVTLSPPIKPGERAAILRLSGVGDSEINISAELSTAHVRKLQDEITHFLATHPGPS